MDARGNRIGDAEAHCRWWPTNSAKKTRVNYLALLHRSWQDAKGQREIRNRRVERPPPLDGKTASGPMAANCTESRDLPCLFYANAGREEVLWFPPFSGYFSAT